MKYKKTEPEEKFAPPVLTVDYEKYAHFLENADLTEDQKREFLQTIWNIIVEFVSLGFGVHPLQQVKSHCGKLDDNAPNPPLTTPDGVYLDHQLLSENFERAADLKTVKVIESVKP